MIKSVNICYTFNDKHERVIVKVIGDFKQAKEWQHNRARLIMKLQRLYASYILAKTVKASDKAFSRYYDFRNKHKLYDKETPSSPFFHTWEVKEKGVEEA